MLKYIYFFKIISIRYVNDLESSVGDPKYVLTTRFSATATRRPIHGNQQQIEINLQDPVYIHIEQESPQSSSALPCCLHPQPNMQNLYNHFPAG